MTTQEEKNETKKTGNISTEELVDTITSELEKTPEKKLRVQMLDEDKVMIDDRQYRLVENYRDAFNPEQVDERYSDVLNRYDYIVGDIGFEQLRLKGFFSDNQKKTPQENRIGALKDYLYEYCNFGCAYFVLEKIGGKKEKQGNKNKRNMKKNTGKPAKPQQAHIEEKKGTPSSSQGKPRNKKRPVIKNRAEAEEKKDKNSVKPNVKPKLKPKPKPKTTRREKGQTPEGGKRNFTIRQKEE